MGDWTSNAQPPLPLPCDHNETGLCPACVLAWVKSASLAAGIELKGVADSAVDVMRKLQWERDEAIKRASILEQDRDSFVTAHAREEQRADAAERRVADLQTSIGDLFYCFSSTKMPEHWDSWYRDASKLLAAAPDRAVVTCKHRYGGDRDECGLPMGHSGPHDCDRGGDLTYEQLVVACKNIGYDLTCGGCASIFYTGTGATHVCGNPPEAVTFAQLCSGLDGDSECELDRGHDGPCRAAC